MPDALPVVIVQPESRPSTKVERLVKWCRELDGTEIQVVIMSKNDDAAFCSTHLHNQYNNLCAYSLHVASLAMKGPFIWIEADSIPVKPEWAKTLTDEYYLLGKQFMLSSDSHPPGDLVGGIGVYGEDTHWLIPYEFREHGWDRWMIERINPLISFTSLIQHKYGHYDGGLNKIKDMSFPIDKDFIRDETVIFHRDPRQTLMRNSGGKNRFAHSGCIGDAIAALATIRQLGGGDLVMTQRNNGRILRGERYEYLKPLLEAQPYISSVTWEEEPEDIDYDFTDFRTIYNSHQSLANIQASYLSEDNLDLSPWLTSEMDVRTKGRIVCSRSPRYQNPNFPWKRITKLFSDRMVFVGLDHEHRDFQFYVNKKVDRIVCKDALELSELIRGASLFIGNQSSSFWIAAGLGQNLIQETWESKPDSIVPRDNAKYVMGHKLDPSVIQSFLFSE